jgi:hypothetical protein
MTEQYVLGMLRRVPDRIILAVMGRHVVLSDGNACLCGWFVREKLAEIGNVAAEQTNIYTEADSVPSQCAHFFGGLRFGWSDIYNGVVDRGNRPVIERAFVQRIDEAVLGRGAQ